MPSSVLSSPHAWIVTSVFDRFDSLSRYFELLAAQNYRNFTLVLVDHGNKMVVDHLDVPGFVCVIRSSSKKWWTGAMNDGISYVLEEYGSECDVLILQNDDSLFDPSFVGNLVNRAIDEDALVGSIAVDQLTGKILHAAMKFKPLFATYAYPLQGGLPESFGSEVQCSDVLKGRGVACTIKNLKVIGLLEERLPHYKADHEWARRAKQKNVKVIVAPDVITWAILDTQLRIEPDKPFSSLFRYVFNKRSPGNIKDIFVYFFVGYPFHKALYFSIANSFLQYAYSTVLAIKYFFRKNNG